MLRLSVSSDWTFIWWSHWFTCTCFPDTWVLMLFPHNTTKKSELFLKAVGNQVELQLEKTLSHLGFTKVSKKHRLKLERSISKWFSWNHVVSLPHPFKVYLNSICKLLAGWKSPHPLYILRVLMFNKESRIRAIELYNIKHVHQTCKTNLRLWNIILCFWISICTKGKSKYQKNITHFLPSCWTFWHIKAGHLQI